MEQRAVTEGTKVTRIHCKTIKAYCNQVERFLSSFPLKDTDVTTPKVQTYF